MPICVRQVLRSISHLHISVTVERKEPSTYVQFQFLEAMDSAAQNLQTVCRTCKQPLRQNNYCNQFPIETYNGPPTRQLCFDYPQTSGPHTQCTQASETQTVSDLLEQPLQLDLRQTSEPHAQQQEQKMTQDRQSTCSLNSRNIRRASPPYCCKLTESCKPFMQCTDDGGDRLYTAVWLAVRR